MARTVTSRTGSSEHGNGCTLIELLVLLILAAAISVALPRLDSFVPALGLEDGRTLFETAAIITFLVTAHADKGLSPPPGSDDFGEFLAWLQLMNSNLYKALNMAFHGDFYAMTPGHNEFIVGKAIERCNALWEVSGSTSHLRINLEGSWIPFFREMPATRPLSTTCSHVRFQGFGRDYPCPPRWKV
jgi:hypothetical protein